MSRLVREACEASYRAALRQAGLVLVLNHASYAGLLLDKHVSPDAALVNCPPEPWFDGVRSLLGQIHNEETRPLRFVKGGKGR